MDVIMAQRRHLFDQRVSRLDPSRAPDWNLVESRDRGVDFRGVIIDGITTRRRLETCPLAPSPEAYQTG